MLIDVGGWKGKKKRTVEIDDRDEGTGGMSGIVLSLQQVGGGVYDIAYTLPVKVGATNNQFSLQIDTGSSDLWIASTSCSTSSCNQAKGHLYDPSAAATTTTANFSIPYLSGSAAGPVVLDSVSIGGYTVDRQAFAAVNDVEDEPLGPNFSGILGLALPLNSIIAGELISSSSSAWTSNLFSITPANKAPSSHFLSLALSRPGSDQIPAVLGIGRHPSSLISDPSLIQYSKLVGGALFWKAAVRGITVYDNGVAKQVQIGTSSTGNGFPSAILDSGIPLIFTTTTIANAIYGSIGIKPANDGMYYVPCTTPLNMTITLDDRTETPLHPLDLTAEPAQENQAQFCTGLIQTADAQLLQTSPYNTDIILGVPFMRNVYTVMAYSAPNSNGSFTSVNNNNNDGGVSQVMSPRLGLLSLTDPTKALQEFHNVRVLNLPISGATNTTNTTNGHGSGSTVNLGGKRVSVGIAVLIGLSSFFAFCGMLLVIRWFLFRRQQRKTAAAAAGAARGVLPSGDGMDKVAYMLTRTSPSKREKSVGFGSREGLNEDELRKMRFDAYMQKERRALSASMSSDQTRVGVYEDHDAYHGKVYDDTEGLEFGLRNPIRKNVPLEEEEEEDHVWDPATALDWGDHHTLTQQQQHAPRAYEIVPPAPPPPESSALPIRRSHHLLASESMTSNNTHRRQNSSMATMQPLLLLESHQNVRENDFDIEEFSESRYPSFNTSTNQRRFYYSSDTTK